MTTHQLYKYELGRSTQADRRVDSNLNFLRNLINSSADAPTLLSLINFRVPPRRTHSTTTFPIPVRATNNISNNLIHRMMYLINVHSNLDT